MSPFASPADHDVRNSAIDFPGHARIHMGLGVSNLEQSISFYEQLLGTPPSKRRPGYAKFEPADPSVNLSLNEVALPAERSRTHYGIQVKSTAAVQAASMRLRAAGLAVREEFATACCYAGQDKIWVTDPDGHLWEVFVVTEANVAERKSQRSACCSDPAAENACC